jgi:hypothetical protein
VGIKARAVTDLDRTEIYEKYRIATDFFASLRDKHGLNNDSMLNQQFADICSKNGVPNVPVFAHVTDF